MQRKIQNDACGFKFGFDGVFASHPPALCRGITGGRSPPVKKKQGWPAVPRAAWSASARAVAQEAFKS